MDTNERIAELEDKIDRAQADRLALQMLVEALTTSHPDPTALMESIVRARERALTLLLPIPQQAAGLAADTVNDVADRYMKLLAVRTHQADMQQAPAAPPP